MEAGGDTYRMHVEGAAIFAYFFSLKRRLDKIPARKTLIVDFSRTKFIDHSVMDHLVSYQKDYQKSGGNMQMTGLENHKPASRHALCSRKLAVTASGKSDAENDH